MRRAPFVVAATVAGVAGVLGFHTRSTTSMLTVPGSESGRSSAAGAGAPAATTVPRPGGANSGPVPAPSATRRATGPNEQYGYGTLAVQVTVNGQKITDVSVAHLQTLDPYSQSIAQQVAPMLRSEVLAAQSTRINGISGATYTCEAYATSLQSALDRLHVK